MSAWWVRSALLALALGAAGLGYTRAFPFHRTVSRLHPAEARTLLAAALEPAHRPAYPWDLVDRPVLLISDAAPRAGLRFELRQLSRLLVAILTPIARDPQPPGAVDPPSHPVYALLRHETLGKVIDYPMTRVGPQWIAVMPHRELSRLFYDTLCAGAWEPGSDIAEPREAAYWTRWNL